LMNVERLLYCFEKHYCLCVRNVFSMKYDDDDHDYDDGDDVSMMMMVSTMMMTTVHLKTPLEL